MLCIMNLKYFSLLLVCASLAAAAAPNEPRPLALTPETKFVALPEYATVGKYLIDGAWTVKSGQNYAFYNVEGRCIFGYEYTVQGNRWPQMVGGAVIMYAKGNTYDNPQQYILYLDGSVKELPAELTAPATNFVDGVALIGRNAGFKKEYIYINTQGERVYGELTSKPMQFCGETYTLPYTGGMFDAGEPLFCDITIIYIYTTEAAQLNDAFVQAHTAYRTVEEWRSALYREEWIANRGPAWEKAFNQLIAESSFALDEKKIEKNAADPEQAKMRVREYLLIKALADHFGLTVSAEDLNDYCARQHVRIELLSLAEQEACEWCALREKVMNRMTGIE